MQRFFIQRGHRRSLPNFFLVVGGERRWPQNKTGVVNRYQAILSHSGLNINDGGLSTVAI